MMKVENTRSIGFAKVSDFTIILRWGKVSLELPPSVAYLFWIHGSLEVLILVSINGGEYIISLQYIYMNWTNFDQEITKYLQNILSIRFVNRFLLQCLEDLDCSLRKLNSRLFVIRGQPADALPKLFKEWGTTNLTFEEDPEPFGRVRDHNISALCKELGISVVQKVSHTLYKLDEWV